MRFKELAQYFEKIEKTSSRLEITHLLADLFNKLGKDEIGKTVYLLGGQLAPSFAKKEFGMAEKMVLVAATKALNIDKKILIAKNKEVGDLGKAIEELKKQHPALEKKNLTILEAYDQLLLLTNAKGDGSQEEKTNILADLIRRIDPLSSRFLIRIPLGVMRMGFSDMTVLDSLSWMLKKDKSLRGVIEKAYHVRPDLGEIATTVKKKGVAGLGQISPQVFTPIIMMRAERLSSGGEIIKKIGRCLIEPKYDGFRLQIHYKKEVKLFSRNLEDVTFMYPDIVAGVKKEVSANEIIFEGEAIGFDEESGSFLPFQETVQRKRKYGIEEKAKEIPLKLFAFELLFKDGKSFLNTGYLERRRILDKTIKTSRNLIDDIILIAKEEIADDEKKIEILFDDALSKGLEGIIAKKLDGIYQPGARGWNWIKFKRSYSSKINDTIDCLVMGYDLGRGKRTTFGIGAFLVGVYDERADKFVTVAKIGTGLSDAEWKELQVKSQKSKVKSLPKNYEVDKAMNCDFWLVPKMVVEIKADEITRSPVHTAHLALRFPRLVNFREDKRPEDATTLVELAKMFRKQTA